MQVMLDRGVLWMLVVWMVSGVVGCASLGERRGVMERPREGVVHIFYAGTDSKTPRSPSGTGFVIDSKGVIATAAHVVEREGLLDVKFVRPDGSEALFVPARVVTLDRERDVALLKIDVLEAYKERVQSVVTSQGETRVGDEVAVYGFPESEVVGFEMRRSSGRISSKRSNPLDKTDQTTRMLELEAKIEPGNSGSPVYNREGEVLGVVSSRWKTTDSYALAVPIRVVWELVDTRFGSDWEALVVEDEVFSQGADEFVQDVSRVLAGAEGVFPAGSEGERVLEELRFVVGRVKKGAEDARRLRAAGADVAAWRVECLVVYEMSGRSQDVAFLRSLVDAMQATSLR